MWRENRITLIYFLCLCEGMRDTGFWKTVFINLHSPRWCFWPRPFKGAFCHSPYSEYDRCRWRRAHVGTVRGRSGRWAGAGPLASHSIDFSSLWFSIFWILGSGCICILRVIICEQNHRFLLERHTWVNQVVFGGTVRGGEVLGETHWVPVALQLVEESHHCLIQV